MQKIIKSKTFKIIFISIFILLIVFNIHLIRVVYNMTRMDNNLLEYIRFDNANSRDTIFTFHNIKKAHETAMGENIKVGILDIAFGTNEDNIYADMIDFLDDKKTMDVYGHGYDMAIILKEVAPRCEIYALNCMAMDDDVKEKTVIQAIKWAADNDIDILSYSTNTVSEINRAAFDQAVELAYEKNIVTTFIHYPNELNILPNGFLPSAADIVGRTEDVNVFNYDYNNFELNSLKEYQEAVRTGSEIKSIPFLSVSSTAPTTAGFVAVLKSINNKLSPEDYKEILMETSYPYFYNGNYEFDKQIQCPRVVDLSKAVEYIKKHY